MSRLSSAVVPPSPAGSRVVVALSGGVDSSVAAALLRDAGWEVIGVTLRLHDCRDVPAGRSCCAEDSVARARAVAGRLGIPHYVLDVAREFERQVLRPAWSTYAGGRTPSPCLLCNERIKFGLLLAWARRLGADRVASGHYARVERSSDGEPSLHRGDDPDKDQSYFLAGLDRLRLAALFFPLGRLRKTTVRELARARGLPTADARDSQNACLTQPGRSFADALRERFAASPRPGVIVDEAGSVLARHDGLHHFTIGQHRRLGLGSPRRLWVKCLRRTDATVVVTDRADALLSNHLRITGTHWLAAPPPDGAPLECAVQLRYRAPPIPATVTPGTGGTVAITLHRPARAVAPGQAAVLYDGDRVLGRGWIDAD